MEKNLIDIIAKSGIVGAGGAGFPTHVKMNAKAEYVIINGAECEPLLRVDQQLMAVETKKILDALKLCMEAVGADKGVIALKGHYEAAINSFNQLLGEYEGISLHLLPNFYPAGDEQITVYEVTGRIVPEGGIPLQCGVIVSNVETMLNIYNAYFEDKPVTDSYVVGYEDGAFKPENNMTRAEAAAIFARNIAERKGENISSRKSSFKDVSSKDWFNNYIAYLEKYKVISGYDDKTFKPDEHITRAEFVTMCMRFYALDAKTVAAKKNIFNDVPKSHWASGYIYSAVGMGWINGYSDSTFKPDSNITRAEVVTIVNRVTGRAADTEYINKNMSAVNKFTDLKDKSYWAFYEILEASNTHNTVDGKSGETWVK